MKRRETGSGGRSPAGGTLGRNGEFYKGGTFLPSTELPKRGASRSASAGRGRLIAPGEYAHPPQEGLRPIFQSFQEFLEIAGNVANVLARPDEAVAAYVHDDPHTGREILQAAAEAYNRGERWYESEEQLLANRLDIDLGCPSP